MVQTLRTGEVRLAVDTTLPSWLLSSKVQPLLLGWGVSPPGHCLWPQAWGSKVIYILIGSPCSVKSVNIFMYNPWRRKWQPTPVLLPGKSHGQRSLVGYSLWGCTESDTKTSWNCFYFFHPKILCFILVVEFSCKFISTGISHSIVGLF